MVAACRTGLEKLSVDGEVLVSASGCTDKTPLVAAEAGAEVVFAPIGKGAAIKAGLNAVAGEIACLIDGDIRYFGDEPLVTILVDPILRGIADATVVDLYWRPLYPQMWLHAFFTPLAGYLFFPNSSRRPAPHPGQGNVQCDGNSGPMNCPMTSL